MYCDWCYHLSPQPSQSQGQILFANTRLPPSLPPKPIGMPPSHRPIPPIPIPMEPGAVPMLPAPDEVGPGKPPNMRNYEMVAIKKECLTLGAELGQGEFGSVLRGKYRPAGGKMVSVCVCVFRVAVCPLHTAVEQLVIVSVQLSVI